MDLWATACSIWAFLNDRLGVALVQLAAGVVLAVLLAERWQRWRQRREFQHRAMLEFSEASVSVLGCLWDLAEARAQGRRGAARYQELVALYPSRLEPLIARDAQFYAVFESKKLLEELHELTQFMKRVHGRICDPNLAIAMDPVVVRSGIDCMTARRRLIIACMALEMDLRSETDFKAVQQELRDQAASVPPEFEVNVDGRQDGSLIEGS